MVVGRRTFAFRDEVFFSVIVLLLICFSGSHLRRRSLFILLPSFVCFFFYFPVDDESLFVFGRLVFDSLRRRLRELTSIFGRTFC